MNHEEVSLFKKKKKKKKILLNSDILINIDL